MKPFYNFIKFPLGLQLGLIVMQLSNVTAQTTFSWRNDQSPTSGQWNVTNYWWNGSSAALPGGGEILFLDGSVGTTMTNDLTSTNRFKITFGTGGNSRTINGSTSNTFYDFGGTWPKIWNNSGNTQTINFPIAASTTSGINLELASSTGSLIFSNTINTNGRTLQVYGNAAVDATNRFVQLAGVASGAGALNVSQFGVAKLNAAHTYTGQTQIDNGELWLESSGSIALGSAVYVGNGGQTSNITKFWLSNTSGGTTCSNNITVNAGNYQTRYIGGLNTSGTHTYSGNITNNAGNLSLSALSTGGTTAFSGVVSGSGQLNIEGSGTVVLSGSNTYTGLSYVTGKLQLNKTGGSTIPSTNNITVEGATANLKVSTNQTINNLSLLNGGTVTVDDGVTLTVNGTLTLTSGNITLGTGNLVLGSSASISGGSSNSYVSTTDAGSLQQTVANSNKLFPVGNGSYTPATLNNAGTSDVFSVKVGNSVTTPTQPTKVVNKQWDISEAVAGGSDVTLSLTWNAGDQASAFSAGGVVVIGHHTGTVWEEKTATVSGTTATASGFMSFSPFAVGQQNALPVELIDFKAVAKENTTFLNWVTASEKNNDHFNIERSYNATDWQNIATIKGHGTTNEPQQYNYTDIQPNAGANYYRLKQVDDNGTFTYSKIVSVLIGKGSSLKTYPNPAATELTILGMGETGSVQIWDVTGKLIRTVTTSNLLNISDLPSGVYLLKGFDAAGAALGTTRFVKN